MKATPEQRLAREFEQARIKRRLSYAAVRDQVRERIGEATPTENAVAAYHKGSVKQRMNLEVIVALCRVYDLDVEKVAPELMPRIRTFRALVGDFSDDPEATNRALLGHLAATG